MGMAANQTGHNRLGPTRRIGGIEYQLISPGTITWRLFVETPAEQLATRKCLRYLRRHGIVRRENRLYMRHDVHQACWLVGVWLSEYVSSVRFVYQRRAAELTCVNGDMLGVLSSTRELGGWEAVVQFLSTVSC